MLVRVSLCAEINKCPPSNRQSLGWAVETLESTTATHRVTIQRHGTVIGYCTTSAPIQVKMEKGVGPSLEWRLCFEDCHRVRWSAVWCFANVMCLKAAPPHFGPLIRSWGNRWRPGLTFVPLPFMFYFLLGVSLPHQAQGTCMYLDRFR